MTEYIQLEDGRFKADTTEVENKLKVLRKHITKENITYFSHAMLIIKQFNPQHAFWLISALHSLYLIKPKFSAADMREMMIMIHPEVHHEYRDYLRTT